MSLSPVCRTVTSAAAITLLASAGAVVALPELTTAHAADGDVVARMTADTAPVTDAAGNVWAPRSPSLGTSSVSTRLVGTDIAGTNDDVLYVKNAWGVTGYSTPVPAAGTYRVRLLMAEDVHDSGGRRAFGVAGEGVSSVSSIDIAAAVGKATAYDVTFDIPVTDGALDLSFSKQLDLPILSAIEVTQVKTLSSGGEAFDLRSTARGSDLLYGGRTWRAGTGWSTGAKRSATMDGQPIGSTADDQLYSTQMWGMTGWKAQVPEAGTYTVQIFTAEGKYTEVGKRVFDVTAEGRTALSGVDVFKAVGVRTAYAPRFDVQVTDGVLDLGFVNKVDYAAIGAIWVTRAGDETPLVEPGSLPSPTSPPTPSTESTGETTTPRTLFTSRMVARPTTVTDARGQVWDRWAASLGSWRLSQRLVGKPVAGTDEPELYRTNVWGAGGYSVPVSDEEATYQVRLLMAEDSFASAGKRVFDVKAEGKPVATNVDIAAAVGINHAYDVTFTTTVTDGLLSLDFVKKIDQPLVSAIEVTSPTPLIPPSMTPNNIIPVSAQSPWVTKVAAAPVAENSGAIVSGLVDDIKTRFGGIAGFNAYEFTVGYHIAPAGTARVTVDRSCNATTWTPGIYDGAAQFLDVPVPSEAVPAVGSDAHMSIYDPSTDKLWSFWQMRRSSTTGRWSACWGGRIDEVSKSDGIYPVGFGAAASGLAMVPGMVTQADVRRGRIDHAVAIVVPNGMKSVFSWPANRTDGVSTSPNAVMQGQRLRLDPALDVDAYNLTPLGRMIAKAGQEYGFIPVDTAGGVAVLAQAGDVEEAETGTNPWRALVGDRQWEVMRNFPWSKMEAMPKDWGRP